MMKGPGIGPHIDIQITNKPIGELIDMMCFHISGMGILIIGSGIPIASVGNTTGAGDGTGICIATE